MPTGTIGTTRPKDTRSITTLGPEERITVDHPSLGVGTIRFADVQVQLEGIFYPTVNTAASAAAASQTAAANSANAAANSQSAAAASASTATTQAGNASTSASSAANSASASATSASAAANSASSAANSASSAAASQTASATSASSAANSASTAATQAGNASTSASSAGNSATSAANSATAAAGSATAALSSQNAAATSASSASNSQAAAATSVSAALASQTSAAGSATSAATSAAAALNSQNAAAASAATALNAQATEYLGSIAGGSVPATVATKGQYYVINAAGTSQGVTWAIGDKAIYNGSSGSWSRITGFLAASNSYAEGIGSTRPAGGYLFSDGATTSRAQIQVPGARGNLAGAPVASWVGWVDVPTSNVSSDYQVFSIHSAITVTPWSSSSLYGNIAPAGHLQITQVNTNLTNSRTSSFSNFRSTYSGQRIWLEVRFTRGTSKPVVYVNGVNVTASFGESGTTPAPDWLDTSTPSTFLLTGANWPAGIAPLGQWLNAHLTDAESEAWRITGRPPAWVAAGGSRVATYTSNFSVDLDGWTEIAGGQSVLTGNIDAVSGVDDTLRISRGTTGVVQIQQPTFLSTTQGTGQGYELIFDYFLDSASGITSIYLGGVGSPQSNSITPVEGAWQTGVRLATNLYTAPRYIAANGALATGKNLYFKNIVLRRIGALSLPAVQPVPVVRDLTTLGGNQARLVGMTPVPGPEASPFTFIDVPASAFAAGTWTQILGGVLLGGRRQRIVSISGNSSANTTLDVGTNGSTATLVSAQTTNGDFDIATFAGRIVPASSSLWLRFAGATTANVTIQLAPA